MTKLRNILMEEFYKEFLKEALKKVLESSLGENSERTLEKS